MNRIVIIGAGPAGISAAIYARRAGFSVIVLDQGMSALLRAEKIENYYGFSTPISGKELYDTGIEGARRLGVEIIFDEVLEIATSAYGETYSFSVHGKQAIYECDAVIIASGAHRSSPQIQNLTDFEGRGVSYCAVCDAFFYRGKTVGVLGAGDYALHEARILRPHAKEVFIFTNGKSLLIPHEEWFRVEVDTVLAVDGDKKMTCVILNHGQSVKIDGLFVAVGVAGSTDLARKVGVEIKGNNIHINEMGATNVPGVFSAGDCTGGVLQIAKAVHEGMNAGLSAVKFLKNRK